MQTNRPLIVDLDGTLLRSDMLVESAFAFFRHNPLRALAPLSWLLAGKANLKARLAAEVTLDVTTLPYDKQVIAFLEREKADGRILVLATASHQSYAEAIASHLGLFDRVLATHGDTNLSARAKRDVLVREYGEKGFDYVGNSHDDLKVWTSAHKAYLANPEIGVEAAATRLGNVELVTRTPAHPWRAWMKQLRLHQWAKNALLFVPLLASHRVGEPELLLTGLLAFLLFGLCASSVYLLNDLLDLDDDRQHASKCFRPLASGAVPIKAALLVLPALLVTAFAGAAWLLPWKFTLALACYYTLTLAYSLTLKRIMTVDVITLAMLYTVRIVAGTFAFDVKLTFWMLAFSMFLFLSLALVKRYAELRESRSKGNTELTRGRGYYPGDLEMISTLGATSGYLAVMVLALYIQDLNTQALYRHPQVIWLACPLLLYWVTRTWMITHRGWMHEDPVVFAMKDRNSLVLGVLFAAVFWSAI
ncbi:MAG: UbiA family prenyltransferase [Gallionellaceae bacterium]|nr:UbiA family prenyltransferase [Gallionellaceae bacterium]